VRTRRKRSRRHRRERVEVQVEVGEGGVGQRREGGDGILAEAEHAQRGEAGGGGGGRDPVVGAVELLSRPGVRGGAGGWAQDGHRRRGEGQRGATRTKISNGAAGVSSLLKTPPERPKWASKGASGARAVPTAGRRA